MKYDEKKCKIQYHDNDYKCRDFVVENQIQSSTHMNLRTVIKEQMTLESNSSNEG